MPPKRIAVKRNGWAGSLDTAIQEGVAVGPSKRRGNQHSTWR